VSLTRFVAGFGVVYTLTWLAQMIAGGTVVSAWGIEYVIFALMLGLFVSNVIGVPAWLREAARSEYYIKTGLVILGTSILFSDLMRAGLLGLAQAVLVVTVVWFACFWVARRLHVDDEFATMLASAVSICGVSAAIAACGAIQGDRRKLSYVTSLVLIVAAPMMVVMPYIVRAFDIPDVVGGAWLGGTLEEVGDVEAAGRKPDQPDVRAPDREVVDPDVQAPEGPPVDAALDPGDGREHARPLARERRRDEHEHLVHEVLLEECRSESRASFEQQRLHAVGAERAQLFAQGRRPKLEL